MGPPDQPGAPEERNMAEINRERIAKKRGNAKAIEYKVDDTVMYWEPAQTKHLAEGEVMGAARKAPNKWKDRWTGPHLITAVEPGKYSQRYTIHHGKRQRAIKDIKADKLAPYHPWD